MPRLLMTGRGFVVVDHLYTNRLFNCATSAPSQSFPIPLPLARSPEVGTDLPHDVVKPRLHPQLLHLQPQPRLRKKTRHLRARRPDKCICPARQKSAPPAIHFPVNLDQYPQHLSPQLPSSSFGHGLSLTRHQPHIIRHLVNTLFRHRARVRHGLVLLHVLDHALHVGRHLRPPGRRGGERPPRMQCPRDIVLYPGVRKGSEALVASSGARRAADGKREGRAPEC